jgi:hypothetical protein
MGIAKRLVRVGGLAVVRGVGNVGRTHMRAAVSVGVAVLVVSAPALLAPTASASDAPLPDMTALMMGATTGPTLKDDDVRAIMNQFIAPTHPGRTIKPVAVTTPEEFWPITGLLRVVCRAVCDPRIFGPGGAAWPDEPWWKLSGLFDLTFDQSVQAGVADLETAMTAHGDDHLVINGYSQGSVVANAEKKKLAMRYPKGTKAPDIDFVLGGDPKLPNGGLFARFPGLYIPILNWSLDGPEPTDTQFDTVVITRQYDFFADFPLYPLNVISLANAVLGGFYVHGYPFDVSLVHDASTAPPIKSQYGDTSYYFFETQDLPLFGPLRSLGVPESVIDVVEPVFRVLVELGYDRSIPSGEPTPARLIPTLDPTTVATDLFGAVGAGSNSAAALLGLSAPLKIPVAPVTAHPNQAVEQLESMSMSVSESESVNRAARARISQLLTALRSELPQSAAAPGTTLSRDHREVAADVRQGLPTVTHGDIDGKTRTFRRELATPRHQINGVVAKLNSAIGNRPTKMRHAGGRGSTETNTRPERMTSVRDGAKKVGGRGISSALGHR